MTSTDMPDPPTISSNWRAPAHTGLAVLVVSLGGLGGWGYLARLDSAAVAPGVVSVETNRKTVQHYEGGIIRDIFVQDGQTVTEGQVLFTLDDTQARANLDAIRNQRAAALAEEARLVAERDGEDQVEFPAEVHARGSEPAVRKAIEDQLRNFRDRRSFLLAQEDVLAAKIKQLEEQINGASTQQNAGIKQLEWIDKELPSLRELYAKGLVQWPRITSLERQRAEVEGAIGSAGAKVAEAKQAIGEAQLQIQELRKQFRQDIAAKIIEVRKLLADLAEKRTVAEDILKRREIRAPQTGVVQGMRVFTRGAVVRSGDTLLDIAPLDEALVVRAQVSPNDMDVVAVGLKAEIRFPTFHLGYVPYMTGHVRALSNDRLVDEATKQPYFAAEIVADPATVPPEIKDKLRAGLPTEVLIATGERTPLEYLARPLLERLRKSMREL